MRELHHGVHRHRLKDNPEEKAFADAWQQQQQTGYLLDHLLDCSNSSWSHPPSASKAAVEVAATVIQWLGSPVGQNFLRDLGYVKKGSSDVAK